MVQDSVFYVREVALDDLKHNVSAHAVINGAYRSEGGWTTEKDLVSGERVTLQDVEDFVRTNGKPNTLLYAFDATPGDSETVVGTVQIQAMQGGQEAELGLFSVSPAYQSRGVGGRLVRAAFERMKDLGFTVAVIHVLETRVELLTWYRKLGFEETGERIPFVWPEMLKVKDVCFITLKKKLV
ncbi:acyl-CoA N-acyltransferase [Zychaea mexicana]|uniref:acyl-CoA N-acyltransferase n=1 Tax=Zychaea mexicana TaxID=64656 RepID=UPI0022FE9FE5|nr:acyl-CoA N-acyltransferase [Zychaea mexicana]KAI9498082.1 acyl-CoA N-acyltransferase [Zychaea mexicana]